MAFTEEGKWRDVLVKTSSGLRKQNYPRNGCDGMMEKFETTGSYKVHYPDCCSRIQDRKGDLPVYFLLRRTLGCSLMNTEACVPNLQIAYAFLNLQAWTGILLIRFRAVWRLCGACNCWVCCKDLTGDPKQRTLRM